MPSLAPVRPAAAAVEELARLLATARRPVFVAGRGARGAGPELRALAAASGALLATSAVAHGLFAGDDRSVGISGGFASPLAAELIRDADLLVGWGCALNTWTTRHGALVGPDTAVVGVPVGRAGPAHGRRRGARPPGPAARRGPRRRRGADGRRGAGDGGAPGAADGRGGLRRRGLRRRGAPLAGEDHACVTFPETDLAAVGRGYGFEAVTVRAPHDLQGVADWVAGPRTAPLLVHAPIASDGGSWWPAEAFRGH